VIVETDRQELVALWNSRTTNRCVVIPSLNQIQELSCQCTYFAFAHIRREANMGAHYTAKFAFASNFECFGCMMSQTFYLYVFSGTLMLRNDVI
jgi:hypothetical protein